MAHYIDVDRLRVIWKGIKARCDNPNKAAFDRYGGRGIKVCLQWESFEGFAGWAIAHGYADTLEIDRINNERGYEPDNCRWVTGRLNRARRLAPNATDRPGRLDTATIEQLVAEPKIGRHWDGGGLYLHISRTGAASWRWKYRARGKEQLLTFGRWPEMSAFEARERREIAAVHLARGKNPADLWRRS